MGGSGDLGGEDVVSTAGKDISWLKDAWNGQKEVFFGPDNGFTVVSRDFDAATDKWKIRLKDTGR